MTLRDVVFKYKNELNGLLLASFGLDMKWSDKTPTAAAVRGAAMTDQMKSGLDLLERLVLDIKAHLRETANDNNAQGNGSKPGEAGSIAGHAGAALGNGAQRQKEGSTQTAGRPASNGSNRPDYHQSGPGAAGASSNVANGKTRSAG